MTMTPYPLLLFCVPDRYRHGVLILQIVACDRIRVRKHPPLIRYSDLSCGNTATGVL